METSVQHSVVNYVKKIGYLFYIMNPSEHVHKDMEDVRDYLKEASGVLWIFLVTELLLLLRYDKYAHHEGMSHIIQGFLTDLMRIPAKGIEMWLYVTLYENYRIVTLSWSSPWVWLLGLVAEDFVFYWVHRMSHCVNILWSFHETHHSPEKLSFLTVFRNHIVHLIIYWVLLNPFALVIPPTVHFVHYQMMIVYQIWVHTERIGKLPAVIEYIFNTPNHHRVHHGRNRKYIDKNFSAVFIIWDRIFGTYQEEDPNDKPVYGTTTQIRSFNPLIIQTNHLRKIWTKFWEYKGITNKLSVLFKGPGWSPGKPWLGDINDIPEIPTKFEPYNPVLPSWLEVYLIAHFSFFLVSYMTYIVHLRTFSEAAIQVGCAYFMISSITIGFMLDKSQYTAPLELIRCLLYVVADMVVYPEIRQNTLTFAFIMGYRGLIGISAIMWISMAICSSLKEHQRGQKKCHLKTGFVEKWFHAFPMCKEKKHKE